MNKKISLSFFRFRAIIDETIEINGTVIDGVYIDVNKAAAKGCNYLYRHVDWTHDGELRAL